MPPGVVYGLDPCVPYTFSVATRSHVSWRADPLYSGFITREYTARLHAPLDFLAFPNRWAGQMGLAWTHAEDHDPASHHYAVQVRKITVDEIAGELNEDPWLPANPVVVNGNAVNIIGLDPALYEARIAAVYLDESDVEVCRSVFVHASGTPAATNACPAPENLGVTVTPPSTLVLTFDEPEGFDPSKHKFKLQYAMEIEDPETGDTEWTEWTPQTPMTIGDTDLSLTGMGPLAPTCSRSGPPATTLMGTSTE